MRKRVVFLIVLLVVVAGIIIVVTNKNKEKSHDFVMMGSWDSPPAANGNPYAPGFLDGAKYFIYAQFAIYKPLTDEYVNYLAESYTSEPKKLTIKMKDCYFWDDGTPLTSKDVKTHYIIGGAMGGLSYQMNGITSIETPDDYTVIFNFNDEAGILLEPYILTGRITTPDHIFNKWVERSEEILDLKKMQNTLKEELKAKGIVEPDDLVEDSDYTELTDIYDDKYKELRTEIFSYKPEFPMGTGPFRVTGVTSSELVMEKVSKYPNIDNIEFDRMIMFKRTSNSQIWTQVRAGNIDVNECAMPPDVVDSLLKDQPYKRQLIAPYYSDLGIMINNEKFPYSDYRFRQALAHLIDRKKLSELALYFSTPLEYITFVIQSTEDNWIDTTGMNPYELSKSKAEELLKEVGLKRDSNGMWVDTKGKQINLDIMVNSHCSDLIIASDEVGRQLTSFGLNTIVRSLDGSIVAENYKSGDFQMCFDFTIGGSIHPYESFNKIYGETNPWLKNLRIDSVVKGPDGEDINITELTEKLNKTFDIEEQKKIVQTLAWATNKYLPVLDMVEKNVQFFYTAGDKITGWPEQDVLRSLYTLDTFKTNTCMLMLEGKLKPGK